MKAIIASTATRAIVKAVTNENRLLASPVFGACEVLLTSTGAAFGVGVGFT